MIRSIKLFHFLVRSPKSAEPDGIDKMDELMMDGSWMMDDLLAALRHPDMCLTWTAMEKSLQGSTSRIGPCQNRRALDQSLLPSGLASLKASTLDKRFEHGPPFEV